MIKSWTGATVTATCAVCGHVATIPDHETFTDERGHCPECDGMVEWSAWRGPVMPRE